MTASSVAVASGRISYALGLRGSSISVDTACSASLVACHMAVSNLMRRETSTSHIAGVHVECTRTSTAQVWAASMLSPWGRSRTLDASADGYARGESCVASTINILEANTSPTIIILGTSVNQDGKTSVLTAPNGPSQQELIRKSISKASLQPTDIAGLQMHGTGTPLGDPIEVGAALAVLVGTKRGASKAHSEYGLATERMPLDFAASKSWVGHGEPAAGLVGVLFAHQALTQEKALPIMHLRNVNPYVSEAVRSNQAPVRFPRQQGAMPRTVTSQSHGAVYGVSAFAFQGTNAHAVVAATYGIFAKQAVYVSKWKHSRYWVWPRLFDMAGVFGMSAFGQCSFTLNLKCPRLAYVRNIAEGTLGLVAEFIAVSILQLVRGGTRQIVLENLLLNDNKSLDFACDAELQFALKYSSGFFEITYASDIYSMVIATGTASKLSNGNTTIPNNLESRSFRTDSKINMLLSTRLKPMKWNACVFHKGIVNQGVQQSQWLLPCPMTLDAVTQLLAHGKPSHVQSMVVPIDQEIINGLNIFGSIFEGNSGCEASFSRSNRVVFQICGMASKEKPSILRPPKDLTIGSKSLARFVEEQIYDVSWLAISPWTPKALNSVNNFAAKPKASPSDALQALKVLVTNLNSSSGAVIDVNSGISILTSAAASRSHPFKLSADAMYGLVKAAAMEYPSSMLQIRLPQQTLKTSWEVCVSDEVETADAYGVGAASNICMVPRLQMISRRPPLLQVHHSDETIISSVKGLNIITGGSGALGTVIGTWLLLRGASICLSSRRGVIKRTALSAASTSSCVVIGIRGDNSQSEDARAMSACMDLIATVFHVGGILADALLPKQTANSIRQVFGPKQHGLSTMKNSLNMQNQPVQKEILFSSIASLFGSPGQSNYSAANAVLDAMASEKVQSGVPAIAIQWGGWSSAGMATVDASLLQRMKRLGIGMIQPGDGMKMLNHILKRGNMGVMAAVPLEWDKFISSHEQMIFSDLHSKRRIEEPRKAIAAARDSEAIDYDLIQIKVQESIGEILGTSLSKDAPFMSAGLDSLGAIELRNMLEDSLGVSLPSTLVFDYPTVESLTQYLAEHGATQKIELSSHDFDASLVRGKLESYEMVQEDNFGLLAVSQSSPEKILSFSAPQHDGVGTIPFERWDIEKDPLEARFGVFFSDIANFDPFVFSLSNNEAVIMDPQQRMLLQTLSSTILSMRHHESFDSRNKMQGMFVGIAISDYIGMLSKYTEKGAYHATSSALSVACGRLSFTFGLQGPSLSIDTACSASLVATHLALSSVKSNTVPLSFTAGVHLQCTSLSTSYVASAGMLSKEGRSKVFDVSADGYVRGESCITAAVMRINNETSCAAILGTAVNQDGKSSILTAPNGPAQQDLLKSAIKDSHLHPCQVSALSLHGTGTPLGDPIEVGAALAVLVGTKRGASKAHSEYGLATERMPLDFAASKSWVGHGEPAAGLVGVLFAHQALTQEKALPIMHLRNVNPYVSEAVRSNQAPVRFPRQQGAMPRTVTSQSHGAVYGVSAFAFQGTNAHALLQSVNIPNPSYGGRENSLEFKQERYYVVPPRSLLLQFAECASKEAEKYHVTLQGKLAIPQLSYIWDHTVLNRHIFPGTL